MRKLIPWIVLALIIRLAVMATTAHEDLFSTYLRSALLLEGIVAFGLLSAVPHIIQAAWLFIIRPVMPTYDAFFDQPVTSLTDNPEVAAVMFSDPYLAWYALLFKIPYLAFEIGAFLLFNHLLRKKVYKNTALLLWLFCIPLIYASYAIGRFEPIALFFMLLTAALIPKHSLLAALPLAALILTRPFFIILVPIYLIVLIRHLGPKYKPMTIIWAVVPIITIAILIVHKELIALATSKFAGYFFSLIFPHIFFPLFPIIYMILLVHMLIKKPAAKDHIVYSSSILIAFFTICFWHVQWLAWVMPSIIVLAAMNSDIRKAYYILPIPLFFALFFWREHTTTLLFSPIQYSFFRTMSDTMLSEYMPLVVQAGILGKLAMSVLMGYIAYKGIVYLKLLKKNSQ